MHPKGSSGGWLLVVVDSPLHHPTPSWTSKKARLQFNDDGEDKTKKMYKRRGGKSEEVRRVVVVEDDPVQT